VIRHLGTVMVAVLALMGAQVRAEEKSALAELLAREIVGPRQALVDAQEFVDPKIPRMPQVKSAEEWDRIAARLRQDVLERVVFRGEAARWRNLPTRVEWQDTIPGGAGYKIRKLRYEAVPGLWVPALLYEPEKLSGKVPVHLAVNGHDRVGKAAPYKQVRCINLAKRGTIVLNVEWLGMGQLNVPGLAHARMNQLDLCGTSGLAPFYLSMSRGLDVLLQHAHADPARVGVSGLSGGGWQTITISSLDTRVKLANPVAGYSSFRTRLQHFKDLGDSEQTPTDLATVADYTHLTAMLAPRGLLLTYNDKDNCCFESGYALPPLLEAATPIYRLFGKEKSLRSHVNSDPGTHNFLKDNRQALYRMVGDLFSDAPKKWAEEIPCDKELKSKDDLDVPLPEKLATFQSLALSLAEQLPRDGELPTDKGKAVAWQKALRQKLAGVVRYPVKFSVKAEQVGEQTKGDTKATFWKLRVNDTWTVPVVELVRGEPKATAITLNDAGRKTDTVTVERLLASGHRVLAVDLWYFGESRVQQKDWLFALMVATVGERPLGVQAGQLAAVAGWAGRKYGSPVHVAAVGPRLSTVALVAAALEEKSISGLDLWGAPGSLKETIEQDRTVTDRPELFCFGLLEVCDVRQLVAAVAPRPVSFLEPSARLQKELTAVKGWYTLLGKEHDPLGK
jgi:hypothetical protein